MSTNNHAFGDPDAEVAVLVRGLRSDDPQQSYEAAEELAIRGKVVFKDLCEAMSDHRAHVRAQATRCVMLIAVRYKLAGVNPAPPEVLDTLVKLLRDPDLMVKCCACGAIAQFATYASRATPDLIVLILDPNSDLAACAAEALGAIGPAADEAAPFLVSAAERLIRHENPMPCRLMLIALREIGKKKECWIPVLIDILRSGKDLIIGPVADLLGDYRELAASGVPLLKMHLGTDDPYALCSVATALGKITLDPEYTRILVRLLHHEDASIRALALIGLAAFESPDSDVFFEINNMINDPDEAVREVAKEAACRIRDVY